MTAKPAFTPGPWIVHATDQIAAEVGDDLLNIAWALSASMGKELPSVANAHLIAAAPDLYDALTRLVEVCESNSMLETVFESLATPMAALEAAKLALSMVSEVEK